MTYPRENCPVCKHILNYAFPAPNPDPDVEAVLSRFQRCKNKVCTQYGLVVDVYTGGRYAIRRHTAGSGVTANGRNYTSLKDWLTTAHVIIVPPAWPAEPPAQPVILGIRHRDKTYRIEAYESTLWIQRATPPGPARYYPAVQSHRRVLVGEVWNLDLVTDLIACYEATRPGDRVPTDCQPAADANPTPPINDHSGK